MPPQAQESSKLSDLRSQRDGLKSLLSERKAENKVATNTDKPGKDEKSPLGKLLEGDPVGAAVGVAEGVVDAATRVLGRIIDTMFNGKAYAEIKDQYAEKSDEEIEGKISELEKEIEKEEKDQKKKDGKGGESGKRNPGDDKDKQSPDMPAAQAAAKGVIETHNLNNAGISEDAHGSDLKKEKADAEKARGDELSGR